MPPSKRRLANQKTKSRCKTHKQAVLLALAMALGPISAHANESERLFESQFHRLEILYSKTLRKGWNQASNKEQRKVRDFFVKQRDPAARFLIRKVELMNIEEAAFVKGSDDPLRGFEYEGHLQDRGQTILLKHAACNILADMFPELLPETQNAIVHVIAEAYTLPSSFPRHANLLDWAVGRIGPALVPSLLRLANHKNETVRCTVSELLESITQDLSKEKQATSTAFAPPELPCRAAPDQREQAIAEWKQWWDTHGKTLPFSRLPSFFEQ